MICDFCGGKTRTRKVTKNHTYKRRLYMVENVTAEVCTECGERYFHATILDAIDRLLSNKPKIKKTLRVEVVSL